MLDCLQITLFAGVVLLAFGQEEKICSLITIYGLKTADCMAFNLTGIPGDLDSDLKTLNLHKNQIAILADFAFKNYSSLQNLHLVNNRIKRIDNNAFQNLRNLQILNLESNQLNVVPKYAFRPLLYMRILNLNNNPITHISSDDLQFLTQIETLKFENCRLEKIDPLAFRPLARLYELNIANNQLKHLDHQLSHSFDSLTVLRLYNNLWHCDCRLRWLRVSVQAIPNWDFGPNSPICQAPDLLRGVNWKHLSPEKFACPSIIYSLDNHQNASNVEITLGSNTSIDCVAWGDPDPTITWMKNGKPVDLRFTSQHTFYSSSQRSSEDKNVRGILSIIGAKRSDEGSYKCIAENSAGRSEVTYKVWLVEKRSSTMFEQARGGRIVLTYEIILGVILGCVLLLGSLLVCLLCVVSRRQRARKIVKRRKSNKKHRQLLNDKDVNYKSDSKGSSSCDQLIGNSFEFDSDKINCQLQDANISSREDKLTSPKSLKHSSENLSDVKLKSKTSFVGRKSFFASSKKSDKRKQHNASTRPDILSNQNVIALQADCGSSPFARKNLKISAGECSDNLRRPPSKCNKSKVTQFSASTHCNNPVCNKPAVKSLNNRRADSEIQKSKIPNSDRAPLKKILKTPSATFDKNNKDEKLPKNVNQVVLKSNRPPDIYATLPSRAKLEDQNNSMSIPIEPANMDFVQECDKFRNLQMDHASTTPAHNIEHLLTYEPPGSSASNVAPYHSKRFQVNSSTVRTSCQATDPACYSSSPPGRPQARESSNMRRYRNSSTDVRNVCDTPRNTGWSTLSKRQDISSSTSLHEILTPPFKKSPVIFPKQNRPSGLPQLAVQPRKKGDYGTAV